jgi:chromosome partitioning protein
MSSPQRRIAVWTQKGGSGKSTTSTAAADALARAGHQVVLVDTERQGNAGAPLLGDRPKPELTLYDILYGRATPDEVAIEVRPGLRLIPADLSLDEAEQLVSQKMMGGTGLHVLADAMSGIDAEFVVFDMGPNITSITKAALIAVDELLLPVQLEPFCLQATMDVLTWLGRWQREAHHPTGIHLGLVVPTMLDVRRRETAPYLSSLETQFRASGNLATAVPRDANVPHSQDARCTLFEYAPRSRATLAMEEVARQLAALELAS